MDKRDQEKIPHRHDGPVERYGRTGEPLSQRSQVGPPPQNLGKPAPPPPPPPKKS
jgi:hypothetical protein